jgi:hypothetical protein
MRKKCPPMAFAGTGMRKFPPYGDGDGGSIPDGDFFMAIFNYIVDTQ